MQMNIGLLLLRLTLGLTLAAHCLQNCSAGLDGPACTARGNSFKCWASVLIASTRSGRVWPRLSAAFCLVAEVLPSIWKQPLSQNETERDAWVSGDPSTLNFPHSGFFIDSQISVLLGF